MSESIEQCPEHPDGPYEIPLRRSKDGAMWINSCGACLKNAIVASPEWKKDRARLAGEAEEPSSFAWYRARREAQPDQ
jgi:hypothetical protein